MSLRRQVIDTLFGGNRDPLTRIMKSDAGTHLTPQAAKIAPIGTFYCIDAQGHVEDDDIYINTNGALTAGASNWSLVYDASAATPVAATGHLYRDSGAHAVGT